MVAFIVEYDLSILGDPINVPSNPHNGAIIVRPGSIKINAKPMLKILEIGFITCNRNVNVTKMSDDSAIEYNKNQLFNDSVGGLPCSLNNKIHQL
jgi:hypothetical protein